LKFKHPDLEHAKLLRSKADERDKVHSTSNAISPQQERTKPSGPRPCRYGAKFPPQKGLGPAKPAEPAVPKVQLPADVKVISIKSSIVVRELAEQLKQKPFKIIADLMEVGVFANVNQPIEESIAQRICAKYGFRFEAEKRERGSGLVHAPIKKVELDFEDKPDQLVLRAPVVTIRLAT